ncbi:unnamed protein product [Microthlaspi erraticum]|uniref:RIN4 pathogenic type III effector avirulence factor Avr cleavage site domain-containing protein n=1 Tax=Microthlaspi erraticum TaxID=1685480 RepID=A0A6D2J7V5_9BRAS|nr:unnamed protein product [Microthlaspi erraticum]
MQSQHLNTCFNDGWTPVPQFGGWDQTGPDATNYSVVFSKARANKKQNKAGLRPFSLGSEQELLASARHHHQQHHHRRQTQDDDPVMAKLGPCSIKSQSFSRQCDIAKIWLNLPCENVYASATKLQLIAAKLFVVQIRIWNQRASSLEDQENWAVHLIS